MVVQMRRALREHDVQSILLLEQEDQHRSGANDSPLLGMGTAAFLVGEISRDRIGLGERASEPLSQRGTGEIVVCGRRFQIVVFAFFVQ